MKSVQSKITTIVGAQWGDEGKGKITDFFANQSNYVVRFHGGNNAGHTVIVDGKIFKLHGYQGEVKLYLNNIELISLSEIDCLYIEECHELIPYFIKNLRGRKKNILIVQFEDINTESEAKEIINKKVFLEEKFKLNNQDSEDNNINQYKVIDQNLGNIGEVDYIDEQSPQKLIKVINKTSSFFIPFHKKFIIEINNQSKVILVDIPEELININ